MIKKLVMVITLILMVVLVFGCSAAKNYGSGDMEDVTREADRISLRDVDDKNGSSGNDDPVEVTDPRSLDPSSLEGKTEFTTFPKGDSSTGVRYWDYSNSYPAGDAKVSFALDEDQIEFKLGLYELDGGTWASVDIVSVSTSDMNTLYLRHGFNYGTPYYDLDAGAVVLVPLYVNGCDIKLKATLQKSGVRTITYLFTDEYDTEKNIILAGFVFISDQRQVMEEFDASCFDEPEKLPDLGENGEVFAITIEFKE